jgi:hypothetical protein
VYSDSYAAPASIDAGVVEATAEVEKSAAVEAEAPKPIVVKPETTIPLPAPDDAVGISKNIVDAAKAGKWALMIGFIVMLLTWLANALLLKKIPRAVMPWLAVGLSVLGQGAFTLASGASWFDAIFGGISMGLVAAGSWSAVGKYIPGLTPKE